MNLEECTLIVARKVAEILNVKLELNLNDPLGSYGLDSIKTIKLLVELEDTFNIVYTDEELFFRNFKSISIIAEKITNKLAVT